MTGHRLEVADVFRAFQEQFFQRWGHSLSDQQRKVLRAISACAAQPRWVLIWNAAIDAATKRWHTTRAATGTVPSASLQRGIDGC
jgi:hypothetical protein